MKINNHNCRYKMLGLCILLIVAAGCAVSPTQRLDPTAKFFSSKEYILYQLQAKDTATSLARIIYGDPRKAWRIEEANPKVKFKPGRYVVIPLKGHNKGGISKHGFQQVPILCYHRFDNNCDSPLCVADDLFERQMKYLRNNGYRTITPEEMLAFLEHRQPLPKKAVMITIDDGYRSAYTVAYPILKKYEFTATLMIYTNYVGVSKKAITWKQLRELKANGFTIGSHTVMHSDLSKQSRRESEKDYLQRLRQELVNSKKIIDKKLNQDTTVFAYPFGRTNETAMAMARKAGYKLAVTVTPGGNPFFTHPRILRRDQVIHRDMATFISRLNTFQSFPLR